MQDHESAFVSAFIIPKKRSRYRQFLSNPKKRPKILDRLNHVLDLDYSYATRLDRSASLESLERQLREKGAGGICHVIADVSELDGRDIPLREALDYVYYGCFFGIIVSCVPGRLALYKDEAPGAMYLLERK
jgi:hypothetical protein